VFGPIIAQQALLEFFKAEQEFGPVNPRAYYDRTGGQIPKGTPQGYESLMSRLPNVKNGFMLRNTLTQLFFLHAHAMQTQDPTNSRYIRANETFRRCFGQIPAFYYSQVLNPGQGKKKKVVNKVPMTQAIQQGMISAPMSSFEVVSRSDPLRLSKDKEGKDVQIGFSPEHFEGYYFQSIGALNYVSLRVAQTVNDASYAQAVAYISGEEGKQALIAEHELVKAVGAEWKDVLKPSRAAARSAAKKVKDAAKKQAALLGQ
jgi:hypothetical protein